MHLIAFRKLEIKSPFQIVCSKQSSVAFNLLCNTGAKWAESKLSRGHVPICTPVFVLPKSGAEFKLIDEGNDADARRINKRNKRNRAGRVERKDKTR